jgi:hypothetical protein
VDTLRLSTRVYRFRGLTRKATSNKTTACGAEAIMNGLPVGGRCLELLRAQLDDTRGADLPTVAVAMAPVARS